MGFETILQALWIIIPAYIANGSAVLVGGGKPIDAGKTWKDGKRILGDGKTWRGLFSGAFVGLTAGFGLAATGKYLKTTGFSYLGFNDFEGFPLMIPIICSLCFGALLGDIVESFFKRRIGKKRGEDWLVFDQLDFIFGALLVSFIVSAILQGFDFTSYNWFVQSFSLEHIIVILIVTPFLHLLSNFLHRTLRS